MISHCLNVVFEEHVSDWPEVVLANHRGRIWDLPLTLLIWVAISAAASC